MANQPLVTVKIEVAKGCRRKRPKSVVQYHEIDSIQLHAVGYVLRIRAGRVFEKMEIVGDKTGRNNRRHF